MTPPGFVISERPVPEPSLWAVGVPSGMNSWQDLCGVVISRTYVSYARPAAWFAGQTPVVVAVPFKGQGGSENTMYGDASFSAINDSRICVGSYRHMQGQDAIISQDGGQIISLNQKLGATLSAAATSVNNANQVVGTIDDDIFHKRIFLYQHGGSVPPAFIEPLPGHTTVEYPHVDVDGSVVFVSSNYDSSPKQHHFVIRRPDGTIDDLGAAPGKTWNVVTAFQGGRFCGYFYDGTSPYGFSRTDAGELETFQHPDPKFHTFCYGVDKEGVAVGTAISMNTYYDDDGQFHQDEDHRGFVRFPSGHVHEGFHDLVDPSQTIGGLSGGNRVAAVTDISKDGFMSAYVSKTPDPWGAYWDENKQQVSFPAIMRLQTLQDQLTKIDVDKLLVLVQMFGGADVGGAGIGIMPNGKIIKIPPRDPFSSSLSLLTDGQRDVVIVRALEHLGQLLSESVGREAVQRAVREVRTANRRRDEST